MSGNFIAVESQDIQSRQRRQIAQLLVAEDVPRKIEVDLLDVIWCKIAERREISGSRAVHNEANLVIGGDGHSALRIRESNPITVRQEERGRRILPRVYVESPQVSMLWEKQQPCFL